MLDFTWRSLVITCFISVLPIQGLLAASLTRAPYLQMNTQDAMTIKWSTDTATDSVVRFGDSPSNLNETATIAGSRTNHEVRITGLQPSTQYFYSVGSSAEVIAGAENSYRFKTSPANGTSQATRVWLIGDSGTANSNAAAVYSAYMNTTGADNTDLWIMLGDNAYRDGTDNEYQEAVFDMYPELLRRTPVWSTLGNHDGKSADSSSESGPYYDIFTLPRNAEAGGLASGTEAYYSFDYGDIHFVCLDSYETNRSSNGAMMMWLENDLAATNKKWIIAYWHHPPYTKGSHDSDSESALVEMRENALPILEQYGVDLVFSGHSHSYERSYLIDGHYGSSNSFSATNLIDGGDGREDSNGAYSKIDSIGNDGAIYTVAGSSGKISGGSLDHPAMYTSLNQLGSVILDINDNRIDARFLNSSGNVTDYYTVTKGADNTAPTLTGANASRADEVIVSFSEALDLATAETAANYSIDGGVSVITASLSGNNVSLLTSGFSENFTYTLTVNNVEDTNNNAIVANSQINYDYQNRQTQSFQNNVAPTADYSGTQDTYIASGAADGNFGSSSEILADGSDGGNGELVSLLKWDISRIPADATVQSAEIVLDVFNSSSGRYHIWRANNSWSEAGANWNSVDPDNSRGLQIGSFLPSSTGSYTINLDAATVQNWVDGRNDGLYIINDRANDGIDIRSSEYGTNSLRPRLNITYSDANGNLSPDAAFSFVNTDYDVNFTDNSSDGDSSIVSWLWDFGDGNTSSIQNPFHTYLAAGTYTVSLTVTDSDGDFGIDSQSVTVSENTVPVTVQFQNGLNGYSGTQDTYIASGAADNNFGSSSGILADGSDGGNGELVSLLKWDISRIPVGATVQSAEIVLDVFNSSNGRYHIWQANNNWSEAGANWNNVDPDNSRGLQIGSFLPSSTGSYTINLDAATVQNWVDGSNNGLYIINDRVNDGVDIRSSEYRTNSLRPRLNITYD